MPTHRPRPNAVTPWGHQEPAPFTLGRKGRGAFPKPESAHKTLHFSTVCLLKTSFLYNPLGAPRTGKNKAAGEASGSTAERQLQTAGRAAHSKMAGRGARCPAARENPSRAPTGQDLSNGASESTFPPQERLLPSSSARHFVPENTYDHRASRWPQRGELP